MRIPPVNPEEEEQHRLALLTRHRNTQRSALRAAVWDKTGGKCWYCGRQTNPFRDFHLDHVLPWSKGGRDDIANLVPCCRGCNQSKHCRPLPALDVVAQAYDFPQTKAEFDEIANRLLERVLP